MSAEELGLQVSKQRVSGVGSCNFCYRMHYVVYEIQGKDPSHRLLVRMCERCVEELKDGMYSIGEAPPRVPRTTGVKQRGRRRKLSDELVKEIRDVWKRDMNRVLEDRKRSYTPYKGLSYGILARRYDVSKPTIANVIDHAGAYEK